MTSLGFVIPGSAQGSPEFESAAVRTCARRQISAPAPLRLRQRHTPPQRQRQRQRRPRAAPGRAPGPGPGSTIARGRGRRFCDSCTSAIALPEVRRGLESNIFCFATAPALATIAKTKLRDLYRSPLEAWVRLAPSAACAARSQRRRKCASASAPTRPTWRSGAHVQSCQGQRAGAPANRPAPDTAIRGRPRAIPASCAGGHARAGLI